MLPTLGEPLAIQQPLYRTPDFMIPGSLAYPLRLEDSPRGLGRTLGKRVGGNPSRVRISYPPPLSERPTDRCFRRSERSTALAGAEQRKGRSRHATGPSSVLVSTPVSTGPSGEHFHLVI